MFGLRQEDIQEIHQIISEFPEVTKVLVFGSRAMGNFRPGSDVDLAISGENLSFKTTQKIKGILNEDTLMPYHFDVVNMGEIENKNLLEHILRVGIPLVVE
jgi:predicted nucleotidyltransferase